jgi:hypothetical protein
MRGSSIFWPLGQKKKTLKDGENLGKVPEKKIQYNYFFLQNKKPPPSAGRANI